MKRTLVTVLGSAALLVAVSPTAKADAFLSLQNGATTLTCNNSTAAGVTACLAAGFTTVLGANGIGFAGAVGGYKVFDLALTSNSPGNPALGFATDTKTAISNVSAGATALTVLFAVNNFALPAGSPLTLSASQAATFVSAAAGSSQAFTGWGNTANTLLAGPGNGMPVATPNCVNPAPAPPVERLLLSGSSGALHARRQLRIERPRDDQSQSGRHLQFPGVNRGYATNCCSGAGFPRPSGNRSVRSRWRPARLPAQGVTRRKYQSSSLGASRPQSWSGRVFLCEWLGASFSDASLPTRRRSRIRLLGYFSAESALCAASLSPNGAVEFTARARARRAPVVSRVPRSAIPRWY